MFVYNYRYTYVKYVLKKQKITQTEQFHNPIQKWSNKMYVKYVRHANQYDMILSHSTIFKIFSRKQIMLINFLIK